MKDIGCKLLFQVQSHKGGRFVELYLPSAQMSSSKVILRIPEDKAWGWLAFSHKLLEFVGSLEWSSQRRVVRSTIGDLSVRIVVEEEGSNNAMDKYWYWRCCWINGVKWVWWSILMQTEGGFGFTKTMKKY